MADEDKPEVVEKRMTDALRNALRTLHKPHDATKQAKPKR